MTARGLRPWGLWPGPLRCLLTHGAGDVCPAPRSGRFIRHPAPCVPACAHMCLCGLRTCACMSVVLGTRVHVHTCVVWDVCVHVFVVRACVHVCRLQACVFVHMLWFADMCACVHVWFEKPPSNSRLVPVLRTGPAWPPGPGWVARGGVWLRLPGHPSARTTAAEPGEAEGGSGRTVTVAPAPV